MNPGYIFAALCALHYFFRCGHKLIVRLGLEYEKGNCTPGSAVFNSGMIKHKLYIIRITSSQELDSRWSWAA